MAQAPAPLAPLAMNARYDVDWGGIPIGRINITAREDGSGYRMRVDTKTGGIAQLFSDERRVAEVEGQGGLGKPYIPSRYASKPQKDTKGQNTLITYDTQGHITHLERTPGDDPKWRPPVPAEEANQATDPITAGFILRRVLYADIEGTTRTAHIKTYDGARLAEMTFTVVDDHDRIEIMEKKVDVINTVVTRKPINGYTPKDLKKFAKGDPEIHLYFTKDAAFLPVKVTISNSFGEISGTLVRNN